MGDSPKWVKSKKRRKKRERKRERAKVGDNNGQAMHGARKHAWRTQAAWANTISNTHPKKNVTAQLMYNTNNAIQVTRSKPSAHRPINRPAGSKYYKWDIRINMKIETYSRPSL